MDLRSVWDWLRRIRRGIGGSIFRRGVDGREDGGGGEVGARAVEIFVKSVLCHQLFAAKEVGVCG